MSKDLLIVYEPALFLLAALGWAGWELWSVRTKKDGKNQVPPPPAGEVAAKPTEGASVDEGTRPLRPLAALERTSPAGGGGTKAAAERESLH